MAAPSRRLWSGCRWPARKRAATSPSATFAWSSTASASHACEYGDQVLRPKTFVEEIGLEGVSHRALVVVRPQHGGSWAQGPSLGELEDARRWPAPALPGAP